MNHNLLKYLHISQTLHVPLELVYYEVCNIPFKKLKSTKKATPATYQVALITCCMTEVNIKQLTLHPAQYSTTTVGSYPLVKNCLFKRNMDFSEVKEGLISGKFILIDVRNTEEVKECGKIPNSHLIPRKYFFTYIDFKYDTLYMYNVHIP